MTTTITSGSLVLGDGFLLPAVTDGQADTWWVETGHKELNLVISLWLMSIKNLGTRKTYREGMSRLVKTSSVPVEWPMSGANFSDVQNALVATVRARQMNANSIKGCMTAFRHFCNWCFLNGYLDPFEKMKMDSVERPKFPTQKIKKHKYILKDVIKQAIETADWRNKLVIEMLYLYGIRVETLTLFDVGDINFEQKTVDAKLKFGGELAIHLQDRTLQTIRAIHGNASPDTPLIGNVRTGERMTTDGIRKAVYAIFDKMGVPRKTLHSFRGTNITDLLKAGVDLPVVQSRAGHANPSTTLGYLTAYNLDEDVRHSTNVLSLD